jgi:hypothetical protein
VLPIPLKGDDLLRLSLFRESPLPADYPQSASRTAGAYPPA